MFKFSIETWLPVFPGFYGTAFEADLSDCAAALWGFPALVDDDYKRLAQEIVHDCFNREDYANAVGVACTEWVETQLLKAGFNVKLTFQRVNSPKEYNFTNDSIDILAELPTSAYRQMLHFCHVHYMSWGKTIRDNYTSRDGFISAYSNDSAIWLTDYLAKRNPHAVGRLLDFILTEYYQQADLSDSLFAYLAENTGIRGTAFLDEAKILAHINEQSGTTFESLAAMEGA